MSTHVTKDTPPTKNMQVAIEYMRANGGSLSRFPGGYWARKGWAAYQGQSFSTPIIHGLVLREIAEYTLWKDSWKSGHNNKFPIEVTLRETK